MGGKAQLPAYRAVAGDLRLYYAQFEELETFARFGTRLDDATRRTLSRGRRVREMLKQAEQKPLAVAEQVAVLLATTHGLLDDLPLNQMRDCEQAICRMMRKEQADLCQLIESGGDLAGADVERLLAAAQRILDGFAVV